MTNSRRAPLLLATLAFVALLSSSGRGPVAAAADTAEVSCEADGTCTSADDVSAEGGSDSDSESTSVPPGSSPGPAEASSAGVESSEEETIDDSDDPCVNLNDSCTKWASEGECKNNPGYMLSHCPRACDVCPPLSEAAKEREEEEADVECSDLHEMCYKWAEEGECVVNPKYMRRACRDSCMLCLDLKAARERGDDEDYIRRKRLYMNLDTGVPQDFPPDLSDDEKYRLKSHLRTMDEYSKGYLLDATTPSVVRERCKNAFGLCAQWATAGMCTDKVVYMLNSCPLACQVCDRTEKFHRCTGKRHPHENAAFEKGGIDEMFKEIKGGKWDEYGPKFLTEPSSDDDGGGADDPYLVRFENFLTDAEADALIDIGNKLGWRPSAVDEAEFGSGNPTKESPRRTSSSAVCPPGHPCEGQDVYKTVMGRISAVIGGVPTDYFESMEMVRYNFVTRDSYGVHHDYRIHDNWKPAGPRVLTVLLILSDMEEGGATGFPDLDWLFVKAKKGTALLWSNVKSDDPTEADRRLVHEGLPVVKGNKFAANVWVHQYNWRKALERDCV